MDDAVSPVGFPHEVASVVKLPVAGVLVPAEQVAVTLTEYEVLPVKFENVVEVEEVLAVKQVVVPAMQTVTV